MSPGDTTVEFGRRCRHCGSELSATSSFCSKCGATAATPPDADPLREKLRDLFGADLDLERELGRGGMAAVYAAFDPALHRRVAVKVLLPEIANDRAAADRFLKEARTVASLQHPHVVTVYSVRSRDSVHAIVMQLVEGRGLDAVLQERTVLPVHVAGMLLSQAAAGLQHAHDRGVIHRDVKPSNVLIDREGRAVVSDFGIARREGGPQTTATGMVVGTWAYMSPEQRAATTITPATDQYALGVMAFELLTGRLPFEGTASEMLRAHLHDPPPSARALRPDVPQAVDALIQRMMAKEPEDRLPSLREAERAFRTLVPDEGQTTLQLAAYSHVRAAGGSQVLAAQARRPDAEKRASAADPRAAPTARTADAPAAVPSAGARVGPALVGAAAGVVVLVAVWQFARGRGERPGAPAPANRSDTSASQVAAPPTVPASQRTRGDAAPGDPSRGQRDSPAPGRTSSSAAPSDAGTATSSDASVPTGGKIQPAPLSPAEAATMPGAAVRTQNVAPPRTDPGSAAGAPPATKVEPPAAPALPVASRDDARKVGRDFVTMLNQRRYRDVGLIPAVGGAADAREELLKLVESAADFAAGFDRLPATPVPWVRGFETEFDVDLEWRGGKKLMRVRLYASPGDGGWHIAGMAVDPEG